MLELENILGLPEILSDLRKPRYRFYTRKRGKKIRLTHEPNDALRLLHERLIEAVGTLWVDYQNATGALPKTSPGKNAERHRHNRHFYQFDLQNAFQHVNLDTLARILEEKTNGSWGHPKEIRAFLAKYVEGKEGGLAEGLPASPLLFNFYAAEAIDPAIRALSTMPGLVYTRFVDDVTISAPQRLVRIYRKRVRSVVESAGFTVGRRKSFVKDRYRGAITITGYVLEKSREFSPPPKLCENLEALLLLPRGKIKKRQKSLEGYVAHLQSFERQGASKKTLALLSRARQVLRSLPNPPFSLAYGIHKSSRGRWNTAEIEHLKSKLSLKEVIEKTVILKPVGRQGGFKGLCPFHNEKTPSFHVHARKGFYHCFGCGIHGDAITFVMETEQLSFRKAIRYLIENHVKGT